MPRPAAEIPLPETAGKSRARLSSVAPAYDDAYQGFQRYGVGPPRQVGDVGLALPRRRAKSRALSQPIDALRAA